ncbi:hypothetical protein H9L19_00075 [Weissella diestrammenae]|uniref:Uncharacterized protein n=1 Tax=Weissella diestrammenae TaxID=1162633 RepID=A0A7G9T5G7_9LACO|nr:hypothetical protein [Weissella diestrammenae]MCM0583203.1 hypothetical protein [Weissella diestrammenae]QNN75342.1 hypothetical protein H9L19_00075 [Weissella diestrammenae]
MSKLRYKIYTDSKKLEVGVATAMLALDATLAKMRKVMLSNKKMARRLLERRER